MSAVFVAERCQLDAHQGLERDHAKQIGLFSLADVWIWKRLVCLHLFVGENDMHRIARLCSGAVEKHVGARWRPVVKVRRGTEGGEAPRRSTPRRTVRAVGTPAE